jgi:RNA polymerase sigma factor (sigma-70 family)
VSASTINYQDVPVIEPIHWRQPRRPRVSATRRTIRLRGRNFEEDRLIRDLRAKDPVSTRHLIGQLAEDRESHASIGLEIVVKAFGPELHAFIWRLAGRNDDSAQEVFSDWLQRVLSRTPSFDASRSAFRTWLYQQAKYAVADWRRKESRVPEPLDPESAASGAGEPDGVTDHPVDVLTGRETGALRRAFRRLRPAQRDLLWWRYVEGWTPTEIARVKLNGSIPDNHVKVYVARAVSKLAAAYDEETRSG